MAEKGDIYDFPTAEEGENPLAYLQRVWNYHNQFLQKPGLPGAISWLIYAGTFFVLYLICSLLAVACFFTIILFCFGILFFLVAIVCLVCAIVCIIICLIYFLVWLVKGAPKVRSAKDEAPQENHV